MSYIKMMGFIIWALIELFRWMERNQLKTELTHAWLKQLEDALKEIEDDVQRANAATTPTDVLLDDPNNRDNDPEPKAKGP
jgi:hypothetical protein